MAHTYYFISDLHIGGDEALGVCDYEAELVAFLGRLADEAEDAELVIVGDVFGMWEFTDINGPDKLQALIDQFPNIFQAFRRAGEKVKITILPGNHDYEIACYPEFVGILKRFNVHLEQQPAITRDLAGKRIWIEHGNQYDDFNHMPDFGNPYAQPVGYFITKAMVSGAGKRSQYGRYNWLKDIQSVYPTEQIPHWVISNYFYHEMSPWLRWLILPFLLLSGLTTFVLAGAALEWLGVTHTNIFLFNGLLAHLGYLGNLLQLVLIIDAFFYAVALILFAPLSLILRDVKKTLKRFRVITSPTALDLGKEERYLNAAQGIFERDPGTVIFIYGHTHAPSLQWIGNRVALNTGTWLKRLERVPLRFGYLPDVYVPFYFLDYFKLTESQGAITIEFERVDKAQPPELNLLQRVLLSRKRRQHDESIPRRTIMYI
ncbi:MAG: metallophosphoesterase [Desulfomonilaceae bacterium]